MKLLESLSKRYKRFLEERRYQIEDMKLIFDLWKKSPLTMLGTVIVISLIFMAIFAPWFAPHDPLEQDVYNRLAPPSSEHLLGTDQLGRDILSRILYGSRISLVIAIIVVAIACSTGLILGLLSGYFGGVLDEIIMRVTDIFLAFPRLVLAMAFAAALGPSLLNTMIAIAVTSWPVYARLARASTMQIRNEFYIEAARSIGASDLRIMFRHVLPMILAPIVVQATLDMGGVILTAAGLGFIGLGAQPPTPEWGVMVSEGRYYLSSQWWVSTFPGLAILITVLGFNLLGDGLRDIFDVRMRR